ncbi:MAG: L-seryl-tRNA(Sec) selenium transferase [Planctomycetota bacterium]|nr:MAG: L-seryl-tRNA(Sec) selenium transferase [Planctomycetota bacterium]
MTTTPSSSGDARRRLPAVDAVLRELPDWPGAAQAVRASLDALRRAPPTDEAPSAAHVAQHAAERLRAEASADHPRVVNGSGILLHTGLGRAPLAHGAALALAEIAEGASVLEVDPADGERRHRESAVAERLCALTGAEAATVVNNNAGALLLALTTLARDRDVIVSRGELVEIGGGFRLPTILELSGARLREVGTTNRTRLADVAELLKWDTGLVLSMHTSNYRVVGFTESPQRAELVELCSNAGVPFFEDIGSGLLKPSSSPLLAEEPDASSALAAGTDLVCFSGDKLLGGPQAGVLLGRKELVERCRRHPLFRALRPDRLALAALSATLQLHASAPEQVPVLAALGRSAGEQLERARGLAARLGRGFPAVDFRATPSEAQAGSGSAPARVAASAAVEFEWPALDADGLARALRTGTPPVFGRVRAGRFGLDLLAMQLGDPASDDGARLLAALSALPQPS